METPSLTGARKWPHNPAQRDYERPTGQGERKTSLAGVCVLGVGWMFTPRICYDY